MAATAPGPLGHPVYIAAVLNNQKAICIPEGSPLINKLPWVPWVPCAFGAAYPPPPPQPPGPFGPSWYEIPHWLAKYLFIGPCHLALGNAADLAAFAHVSAYDFVMGSLWWSQYDDTLGRIPGGGHPFISCTVLQMLDRLERKALWLRDGLTVARCSVVTTARCVACAAEQDPHAWWLDRDVVNKHGGCRLHNRSCRETCPYGEETTPRVTWCHCDGFKHNPNTLLLCGGCGLNMCIWHMGGVPGQLGPHDREWEPNHDCSRYRGELRSNMVPVRPPVAGPLALGWSSETASSRALSNRQLRAISANTMGDATGPG